MGADSCAEIIRLGGVRGGRRTTGLGGSGVVGKPTSWLTALPDEVWDGGTVGGFEGRIGGRAARGLAKWLMSRAAEGEAMTGPPIAVWADPPKRRVDIGWRGGVRWPN